MLGRYRCGAATVVVCAALWACVPCAALDRSVPAIGGDASRLLLGDGTGVTIGIVDSGVDSTHQALAGLDSLGNPRLVAQSNFVATEPENMGDDVYGHGTWVASVALSSDGTYRGMAPDARYINARVLDSSNNFPDSAQIRDGLGFAIEQGADVLNLSLNFFSAVSSGMSQLDLMLDWAAFHRGISCSLCAGNILQGDGTTLVRGPGSAFNGVTVGRTDASFGTVHVDSATAFTSDGRMKPDVVAPGSGLLLANDDWEGGSGVWEFVAGGCSFATPHVAGLMAQQIEAGRRLGWSTNPLVIKANLLNSAVKVPDKLHHAWQPASVMDVGGVLQALQPLDVDSGAGQVDGRRLAEQYMAGEQMPGLVDPLGWDLNQIGQGESIDYTIEQQLRAGSQLTATLTWFRHVGRLDDGDGVIDSGDTFYVAEMLDNLALQILQDGVLLAESVSALDNVEHLSLMLDKQAHYTIRVVGQNIMGADPTERFAVAWSAVAVPEPAAWMLAVCGAMWLLKRGRAAAG